MDLFRESLQKTLSNELGSRNITNLPIPEFIENNLNPNLKLRPYQEQAFQYFLAFMEEEHSVQMSPINLLFHMATGSGKTLIMAGLILYLYKRGYRNFLFFVNATNIIKKTEDNFINSASPKYLFADRIMFENREIKVRKVENFESGSSDDINIHFTTIQGLHSKLNNIGENQLSYADFEDKNIALIADEAHHINAETKKSLTAEEKLVSTSWEGTVTRIFNNNPKNILLEFTATMDFKNPYIEDKYINKVIFDYTLKKFCADRYSKGVQLLRADLEPMDRALQAVILSQYRRKIAEKNKLFLKPVILMKSETNKATEENYNDFINLISDLKIKDLNRIRRGKQAITREDDSKIKLKYDNVIEQAFDYFEQVGITDENLIKELQQDFSREKVIYIHSKEDSEEKQLLVNNLEAHDNEIRVIFNTDKLTEGWDVLNLFDIVRLYETRDSGKGKVGGKTISEAQLIGRGARYNPFSYKDLPKDKRKFDDDLNNELRLLEELHYHSPDNHRYIAELKQALIQEGIWTDKNIIENIKLKDSFKNSRFFNSGLLFLNNKEKKNNKESLWDVVEANRRNFRYIPKSGHTQESSLLFSNANDIETIDSKGRPRWIALKEFSDNIFRTAISMVAFYRFDNLKNYLLLDSIDDFIESLKNKYNYEVLVQGPGTLSSNDKLNIVLIVLNGVRTALNASSQEWQGTKVFEPAPLNKKIPIEKTLKFMQSGEDKEYGKSVKASSIIGGVPLDSEDWYVYNDCFGTSEEKHFINFIYSVKEEIKASYDNFYLIKSERAFKIYDFDSGRATEPDFVLYLQPKDSSKEEIYQLFIEPKGNHLLKNDKWKEDFLEKIEENAKIELLMQNKKYRLFGMPFYNEGLKNNFIDKFKETIAIK